MKLAAFLFLIASYDAMALLNHPLVYSCETRVIRDKVARTVVQWGWMSIRGVGISAILL